jgi:hypothetical protein
MKRCVLALLVTATIGWVVQPAKAQPLPVPGVSPYQLLNRPGTNPAVNYFSLIQPEFAFRNAINDLYLNGGVQQWQTGSLDLAGTGHAAGFQTHYRYFRNLGAPRGGFGGQGGQGGIGGQGGLAGGAGLGANVGGAGGAGGMGGVGGFGGNPAYGGAGGQIGNPGLGGGIGR